MRILLTITLLVGSGYAQNFWQPNNAFPGPVAWTYDHSWRATRPAPMQHWDLREEGGITEARGDRPFSDFITPEPPSDDLPLGDIAREYRALPRQKATRVWMP